MRNGLLLTILLITSTLLSAQGLDDFFNKADDFFEKYSYKGLIKYKAIKQNPGTLDKLIKTVEQADLSDADQNTKKAFWINAFNLLIIKSIVAHYPVSKVKDIDGFFTKKRTVAGKSYSLNDLRNKHFKQFNDPRIFFALTLGAQGSPPFANFGFKSHNVESDLNKHLRNIINKDRYIRINRASRTVFIPVTFHRYKKVFQKVEMPLLQFINRYLNNATIPADYEINYYPFSWKLNDAD